MHIIMTGTAFIILLIVVFVAYGGYLLLTRPPKFMRERSWRVWREDRDGVQVWHDVAGRVDGIERGQHGQRRLKVKAADHTLYIDCLHESMTSNSGIISLGDYILMNEVYGLKNKRGSGPRVYTGKLLAGHKIKFMGKTS